MIVAGSVQLTGPQGPARGGAGAEAHARLRVLEREALDDARVRPRRSVLESVTDMLEQLEGDRAGAAHRPAPLQHPLARAPAARSGRRWILPSGPVRALITGGRRAARVTTSPSCSGRTRPSRRTPRRARHRRRGRRRARLRRGRARRRLQLRRLPQRRRMRDRGRAGLGDQRPRGQETSPARRRAKLVHVSTNYVFDGEREEPYAEDDLPSPRSSTRSPSWPASTRRWPTASARWSCAAPASTGRQGNASKGGNFVQRMHRAGARAGRSSKMVADQRLQPTFTADLATALVEAVEADADGRPPPDRGRRVLLARVHARRSWSWPGSTCRSRRSRPTSRPGGAAGR